MKKLIALLLLTTPCLASGPKYIGSNADPALYQETVNIYQDIKNPTFNLATGSSETLKYLNVSTITLNGVNITAPITSIPIYQIVSSTSQTPTTTTSVSFVATSLSRAITPSAASHRILIVCGGQFASNGGAGAKAALTITRGGTNLDPVGGDFFRPDGDGITTLERYVTLMWIDSPNTTSSTTYDVRIRKVGTTTAQWGDDSTDQFMYLFEIGS